MKKLVIIAALLVLFTNFIFSENIFTEQGKPDKFNNIAKIEPIKEILSISNGEFKDKINIALNTKNKYSYFLLEKSNFIDKDYILFEDFKIIKEELNDENNEETDSNEKEITTTNHITDSHVIPGLVYWYKIYGVIENEISINNQQEDNTNNKHQSDDINSPKDMKQYEATVKEIDLGRNKHSFKGYTSTVEPKFKKLDVLLKNFKKKNPVFKTEEEKQLAKTDLEFLKKEYINPVQLDMILFLSKPYFDSGNLIPVNNLDCYSKTDNNNELIVFNKEKTFALVFFSKKLFRLQKDSSKELFKKLIENGIFFCTYKGIQEVTDADGMTRIIPVYDTVSLATQYYKDNINWKNQTVMIMTSRKELLDEIKKAQGN